MAKKEYIKIKQIRSTIKKPKDQIATIKGLGLGKINKVKELEYTDSVKGMISKVSHLIKIID